MMSAPQRYHSNCAYHPEEKVTHFCQCSECLLPVCCLCQQLHIQQHSIDGSFPQFTELTSLITDIQKHYSSFLRQIESTRSSLLRIEEQRRKNQVLMKETLVHHQTKLVEALKNSIKEMQATIVQKIIEDDQEFIRQLTTVDSELQKSEQQIKQRLSLLKGKNMLREVIRYEEQVSFQTQQKWSELVKAVEQIERKSFTVTVDQSQINKLVTAINVYMKVQCSVE